MYICKNQYIYAYTCLWPHSVTYIQTCCFYIDLHLCGKIVGALRFTCIFQQRIDNSGFRRICIHKHMHISPYVHMYIYMHISLKILQSANAVAQNCSAEALCVNGASKL